MSIKGMTQLEQYKQLEKLKIFSFKGVQVKTFHITWFTFFVCFFGWFGLAPLMPIIREDLHLTKAQVGNVVIASVSATIIGRIIIGKICDAIGPRKTYTILLVLCSMPVIFVGLSANYITFLIFRLLIGLVGASFVLTQIHAGSLFAKNIKGTANAVAAGWGNMGGGLSNILMPLIFSAFISYGFSNSMAWRYAMVIPGVAMLIMAFVYYKYTIDIATPSNEKKNQKQKKEKSDFLVLKDRRVWTLTLAYAVCFGMEITFTNIGALHFTDTYHLSFSTAGLLAGIYGCMNLFARAIGGIMSDRLGSMIGMRGKGWLLAVLLLLEGISLLLFSNTPHLPMAIFSMIIFAVFIQMANGATFGIAPFVSEKNTGLVSGIVGAGGNIGGMLFGFLFKADNMSYAKAFTYIGFIVIIISLIVMVTRFEKKAVTNNIKSSPVIA